jgi:hypothetical protein
MPQEREEFKKKQLERINELGARVRAAIYIQTAWRARRNRKQFNKLICRVRVQDHVTRAVKQDRARYRWQEAIDEHHRRVHLRLKLQGYAQMHHTASSYSLLCLQVAPRNTMQNLTAYLFLQNLQRIYNIICTV